MTEYTQAVVAGVDSHRDEHHVAVVDGRGELLGSEVFPVSTGGYQALCCFVESYGEIERVGVESTGALGAGLTRELTARGVRVVEVNQRHHQARSRRGKSDPLDAELAARAAQSGLARAEPKDRGGIVEAIRQLAIVRESAVRTRARAFHQFDNLLITAPEDLRATLAKRRSLRGKLALCLRLRPAGERLAEPAQAARVALRSLARRIRELDTEIAILERALGQLVGVAAPRTLALLGLGLVHTAQLLVSAGQNIGRLKGEAAFARICGAAPIPASSGRTVRHRLDPGGDRAANRALHLIAVCRLRHCPRTRAYAARRQAEGLSKREIIRCLKRYIAREVYRTLRADLAALSDAPLESGHA